MTLAILCSGQGRQHPGMFALTGDAPEAATLFAHAAKLLDGREVLRKLSPVSVACVAEAAPEAQSSRMQTVSHRESGYAETRLER